MFAINIAAFEDVSRFKHRVDVIVRRIHGSRPMAGVERVLLPGEPELVNEKADMRDGIPMSRVTREALAAVAEKVGVDARWLL
jgi:ureidoglycolate dehydrogenase (NAD+)